MNDHQLLIMRVLVEHQMEMKVSKLKKNSFSKSQGNKNQKKMINLNLSARERCIINSNYK